MKTIYLVRHGHIDNPDNVFYDGNVPLSSIGAKEMVALANDMKAAGHVPEKIIASPYLRARESAEAIAHTLGDLEVTFDDRLVDWRVGDWIGKPLDEFRRFAGYYNEPFEPNFEGMETYSDMADRVMPVILALRDALPDDGCGVIVSHREPLGSAILRLTNRPDNEMRAIQLPKGSCWKLIYKGDALESIEPSFNRSSQESVNTV